MIRYALVLLLAAFTMAWAGDVKKVDLTVKGMHCESCSDKVKSALEKVKDVQGVEVSLKKGSANVSLASSSATTTEVLAKAVAEVGFTASYKDGKETKTVAAATMSHKEDDCDEMVEGKKSDRKKDGAGCCEKMGTKKKETKETKEAK